MGLGKYKAKRTFGTTPEPTGGTTDDNILRFVIQKHDASHLHYDFRLEMGGVLKSWAVPKGPSTDPEVKRLAMMVEDHPYDYRTFEGIIPEGNYGAGTVIVWDEGTYTPIDKSVKDKKAQEKELLKQLHQGNLKFVLKGKKLKGEFALVKTKGYAENSWLLIKHDDKYASTNDITLKDKSVISKHNLEYVEKHSHNIYGQKASKTNNKLPKTAKRTEEKANNDDSNDATPDTDRDVVTRMLKAAPKTSFPSFFKPMLATRADKAFDGKDWLYEIKWDGYRALSFINGKKVEIFSRNEQSFNVQFKEIKDALAELNIKALIDGEIVALKDDGNADFQSLQNFARKGKAANIVYYVFDITWCNGKDLKSLPLIQRKEILRSILPADNELIRYSDHIVGDGIQFFNAAKKKGLEGVMAKKAGSEYDSGVRTTNWLKIKNDQVTEAIICGYTKGRNSRQYFGAVILGKYINKKLTYIGHSGSGFNDAELKEMHQRFKRLETDICPFKEKPKTNMPAIWLKPEIVCEVKFAEWTGDNILRQPIFNGLRDDKNVKTERVEKVMHMEEKGSVKKVADNKRKSKITSKEELTVDTPVDKYKETGKLKLLSPQGKPLFGKGEREKTIWVGKHDLKFTNLDKIYWPKDKVSKGDMIAYYHKMAPYILPYMIDRPQSLNRYPEGIEGFSFYQKDVKDKVAEWLTTYEYFSESNEEYKRYLVCDSEASLLYMASMGCIELHPWHSRIQSPDNPDWCVVDLDPDNNSYDQVIEVALVIKQLLDSVKVPAYCKTSGSTGMHICIPLGAKYTYEQSKLLAELIVNIVYEQLPDFTSIERNVRKRKGKIYLDFLQNRSIQTIAAPYSLRPKPGATVSAPLLWEEVKKGLKISDFNIHNMPDRVKDMGDLFKGILGRGIDLDKTIQRLNALMQ